MPETFVLCMRRSASVGKTLAFGSTVDWCSRCNAAVMIAPSGRKLVTERAAKIICLDCAPPGMVHGPTLEQVREMNETFRILGEEPPTPDQYQDLRLIQEEFLRRKGS